MILEVIATTVTEAKAAQAGGANRIELITAIKEGGLTPSLGLVEEVVKAVTIPVNVMIRPHSHSFVYDADDVRTMLRDIRLIRETGAHGIVVGALTKEGAIDVPSLELFLEQAGDMWVTFHRAIDEAASLTEALNILLQFPQIKAVLTSGGKPSVLDAVSEVKQLVEQSRGSQLSILAGSGLSLEAVEAFVRATSVPQVHFGTGVRVRGGALEPIDPEKIKAVQAALARASAG